MQIFWIIIIALVLIFGITAITGAPYVPSKKQELYTVFKKLYKLSDKDLLVDLGSGDGKVLAIAKTFGADAVGVELNPILAGISRLRGLKVYCRDMFHYKFPEKTTIVYVFGDTRDMPRIVRKIRKEAARLGRPLFLISLAFKADNLAGVKRVGKSAPYFLYKVIP